MKSRSGDFDVCAGPSGDEKTPPAEKPATPTSKQEPEGAGLKQPVAKRGRTGWFNPLLEE